MGAQAIRLLLVDDEPDLREALADYLTQSGFEVESAETVDEALHKAAGFDPQLLLTDLSLPDGDPVVFLTGFTRNYPQCAVFLHSGVDAQEARTVLHSLKLPDDRIFSKPCDLADMARIMRRTLLADLL